MINNIHSGLKTGEFLFRQL